jgi:ribonuclease MRP protein subunit RMP1
MLTGTLARVQKILKSLMKKREDEDADRSLDISGDLSTHEAHDFGEVLKREETQKITADWGGVEDEEVDAQDVSVEAKKSKKKSITMEGLRKHGGSDSTLSKPPKKKKKKKKGDEFDDLFGSL